MEKPQMDTGFTTKVIGFVGVESCEMICYIGRIIYSLGKNVLFADCSEFGALMECVPEPHFPATPDFNPNKSFLEHRGMEFLNYGEYNSMIIGSVIDTEKQEQSHNYMLVDFGFKINHEAIRKCDVLIMCCNQHRYNVRRLSKLQIFNPNQKKVLLVSDYVDSGMPVNVIMYELKLEAEDCDVYCLPYSETDTTYHLKQRYAAQSSFRNLSKRYKQMLTRLTLSFSDELNEKAVYRACKGASVCREKQLRQSAC